MLKIDLLIIGCYKKLLSLSESVGETSVYLFDENRDGPFCHCPRVKNHRTIKSKAADTKIITPKISIGSRVVLDILLFDGFFVLRVWTFVDFKDSVVPKAGVEIE